jgi:hypothetical protein
MKWITNYESDKKSNITFFPTGEGVLSGKRVVCNYGFGKMDLKCKPNGNENARLKFVLG